MINFLNMVLLMLLPRWRIMLLFQFLCFTMINDAGKVKGIIEGRELIFSNFTDVRKFHYGSPNHSLLLSGIDNVVRNIAYDYRLRHLFYELETTIIKRTNMDKLNKSRVVVEAMLENNLYGMAVDWVTHKLYFTNEETNHVSVSRYDGKYRRVLVSRGLDQPRGIAVLPQKGYMFVTDWGDSESIVRFNMDGSGRKVIVNTDIKWPFCITVDMKTYLIYWGDAFFSKIEYMTTNGTNRTVIQLAKENRPHHLTAFDNELFWSDAKTKIYSVHTHHPKDVKWIDKIGGKPIRPFGLEIYSKDKQPLFRNGCSVGNGGCSHLCLLIPTGYSCACPTGIAIKEDNKTCEKGMKQFLLIARKMDIRIMSLDADKNVDVILPIKGIKHGIGIEYDVEMEKVYWADMGTESINRAFLNGTGFEQVISYDMKAPDHLAIDWIARNIYWTESELDRIEVARIDGTSRKIIISERLEQPRGIVVDPADGKIYWTDWGNNSKIESADLDGDNREVLVDTDLKWPNGITLDYMNRKLYWVDAKFNSVNSFDLHSRIMQRVYSKARHPFGITVLGSYLYWTDWHRIVMKYHLETQEGEKILERISDVMGIKGVNTEPAYGMNDCYYKKNNCSHLCFHKPHKGSICACPTRMELKNDRKTCKMPSGFLLYSVSLGIMKMSIDTYKGSHRLPLNNANTASLMDTYYETGRIFWLDDSQPPSINWAFLNGSGFEPIVEAGLSDIQGLAVDWMAENIYWIHNEKSRIEVARVDGRYRRILVYNTADVSLQFLLLNPHISKMFWFQNGKSDRGALSLWESNLDGSSQNRLISLSKVDPKSCTIDYETSTIYWIHSDLSKGKESIQSFDYHTKTLRTVKDNLPYCRGLLFFGGSLIYADHEERTIKKIPVNNSRQRGEHVLVDDINWVLDIKAFHGSVQSGSNVCSVRNGGCQHLCIALSLRRHVCLCATHYTLNRDKRTCTGPTHFMIFNHGKSLIRILLDKVAPESPLPIPIKYVENIRKFEFDVVRGYLYWLDVAKRRIVRSLPNGRKFTFVLQTESPYDFSLDSFSNTIYWTDAKHNSIKFLHLNTSRNGTVVRHSEKTGIYYPRKICVFSKLGKMFWSSEKTDEHTTILSSTLAGTEIKKLKMYSWAMVIQDMKIDYLEQRIYWLEAKFKTIYSMSVHGHDEKTYKSKHMHTPVSIGISATHLYWADSWYKRIYRRMKGNYSSEGIEFQRIPLVLTNLILVNRTRGNESHPCLHNNGGCSHICSIGYSVEHDTSKRHPQPLCSCPLRQTLSDGFNCIAKWGCKDSKKIYCADDSGCYDASMKCDYKIDCPDWSDEHGCSYQKQPCPSTDLIPCGEIGCIHIDKKCDGHMDCPNMEDELDCDLCGNLFRCDHDICLAPDKLCDGRKDCSDGTDEQKNCCPGGRDKKGGCKKLNSTIPTTTKVHEKKRMVAGIISGVIICVIVIMFTFLLWFKLCNSKKNAARDVRVNGAVWSLAQLSQNNTESMTSDDKTSHAKSSVSTYISAVSQNTEPSFYDRNNVTGASSTTALSGYSHLPYNPPPSPMTQRALSTITESNGPYGYSSCEHCRSTIKEVPLSEVDHNDPPPTLASTLLLEDVDMYLPLQKPPQNSWEVNSCNTCQTTKCRSNKSRRSNHMSNHRRGSSYINNFSAYEHNEQSISEMEPLQDPWIYGSEDINIQPRFDTNSTFMDSKRFFCLDPPPTPCTNYMSEDEARPPSPTETELSLAYRLINNVEAHYAPPPSPTSQL